MAKKLKCWRKILPRMFESKGGVVVHKFQPRSSNKFIVRTGKTDEQLLRNQRKFKTESKALKYAQDYMKKHNVC